MASLKTEATSASARLQQLIHRTDKVLAVMHPPTAALARIMEKSGCEALFVGTGGVVGAYTGLADVGTADDDRMRADRRLDRQAVCRLPVIMDGDTGHGGIMAVRRMVRECIRAGIAGVRIDDQPIEGKRRTQSAGVEVVPHRAGDRALSRRGRHEKRTRSEFRDHGAMLCARCGEWRAGRCAAPLARLMKKRQGSTGCNSNRRIRPRKSASARQAVSGPLSFMKGKLPRYLSFEEHLALGVTIAWLPGFTHHVIWAALSDFMADFSQRGIGAWDDFIESRKDRPYVVPEMPHDGEGLDKQRMLEERYLASAAAKYGQSPGGALD